MIGRKVRDFVPKEDMLAYSEAIMRVYNENGRRDNNHKARIKILVHEIGGRDAQEVEASSRRTGTAAAAARGGDAAHRRLFRAAVLRGTARREPNSKMRVSRSRVRRIGSGPTSLPQGAGLRHRDDFAEAHRRQPGDATADQMDAVADMAERWPFGEVRVTHEQNLVLPHVRSAISTRSTTRSTRSISRSRTPASSPTSSPAPVSTIATSPMRARSTSPSEISGASPISNASTISAS